MDIRNFITFQAVVDCGGFTKAAERLGYAQSSVTAHIQELESFYNKQVFDRIGKSVVLTQFGTELLERARILLHEYDIACNISQSYEKPHGRLKIGIPESLLLYRIYPIIREYKERHPEVEVIIVVDVCLKLIERLQNGELDICFCLQPALCHQSLNTLTYFQEKFVMVAPASYNKAEFKPEDDMLVLFIERGIGYRGVMEMYFESIGFRPKNILEMSSVEAIKKCLIGGSGITVLPDYAIQEEIDRGLLKAFDCLSYEPYYTQVLIHSNKWVNPAMKAFIDLTKAAMEAWGTI